MRVLKLTLEGLQDVPASEAVSILERYGMKEEYSPSQIPYNPELENALILRTDGRIYKNYRTGISLVNVPETNSWRSEFRGACSP